MSLNISIDVKSSDVVTKNKIQTQVSRQKEEEKRETKKTEKAVEQVKQKDSEDKGITGYDSTRPRANLRPLDEEEPAAQAMLGHKFGACILATDSDEDGFALLRISTLNGSQSVTYGSNPGGLQLNPSGFDAGRNVIESYYNETSAVREVVHYYEYSGGSVSYVVLPGPRENCIVCCWREYLACSVTERKRVEYEFGSDENIAIDPQSFGIPADFYSGGPVEYDYKSFASGPNLDLSVNAVNNGTGSTGLTAFLVGKDQIKQIEAPASIGALLSVIGTTFTPITITAQARSEQMSDPFMALKTGIETFLPESVYNQIDSIFLNQNQAYTMPYEDRTFLGPAEYAATSGGLHSYERYWLAYTIFSPNNTFWLDQGLVKYGEFSGRSYIPGVSPPPADEFYHYGEIFPNSIRYKEHTLGVGDVYPRFPDPPLGTVSFDDIFYYTYGYETQITQFTFVRVYPSEWSNPSLDLNNNDNITVTSLVYHPLTIGGMDGNFGFSTPGILSVIPDLVENISKSWDLVPFAYQPRNGVFVKVNEETPNRYDFYYLPARPADGALSTPTRIVGSLYSQEDYDNIDGSIHFTWDWNKPRYCIGLLETLGFKVNEFFT